MKIGPAYRNIFRNFVFAFAYYMGTLMSLSLLSRFCSLPGLLSENLLNWDAAHYHYIATNGYTGFRVAFFPLFSVLWRIFGGGVYTIVFFNGALFIVSLTLLATVYGFTVKQLLLMVSFPSLIFMFLPYSESIFFFGCVLLLIGLRMEQNAIGFIGALIASLTRPVIYVFLPAILIILLITKSKSIRIQSILNVVAIFIGLASVIVLQHNATGDWLAFFHMQKLWGNSFQVPKFHFTSWAGDNIVRLDASALLVGIVATVVLINVWFKRNGIIPNEPLLFSLLYLAGICWIVLLTRGGSMFSLNRFIYATPFFFIALAALLRKVWSTKALILVFFTVNAFWLLFGSYVHIQETLKYLLLTLFLMCFLFISHPKKYVALPAFVICLAGNVFLQIYFYYCFLDGCWVG